ncbi:hypothetical protein AHF37_09409 [Paragonimus kellicotti]|nr:hypothetical protein AHF37_09409 [Paragonimus kellicotti]
MVGQAVGRVDLIATTRPDQPSQPRLVNATSSSLAVSWTQGFSGGPPQKFQLRWAPNDHPEDYKQIEVGEDVDSETVTYNIVGELPFLGTVFQPIISPAAYRLFDKGIKIN